MEGFGEEGETCLSGLKNIGPLMLISHGGMGDVS
jgi:hypothetical protein